MVPQNPQPDDSSTLAAKVAHELNNPLDAVLRFVSLAQRKAKAGQFTDIERYLTDAQFGLQRMAEVLRELMDIGRQANDILAAGGAGAAANIPSVTLPLADLVARATRTAAALAEQKGVNLVVKSLISEEFAARMPSIDLRIAQILSNLLKNAIEAAPENTPVRLTVSTTQIKNQKSKIEIPHGPSELVITIEDQGPGIHPDILPQLFTPFLTTKPPGEGHGLGLAISKELALSLHGTLALCNTQTGCLATLTLPLPTDPLTPSPDH